MRQLAQADPAHAELAVHRACAAAAPAAGVAPGRIFRCPLLADALGKSPTNFPAMMPERLAKTDAFTRNARLLDS